MTARDIDDQNPEDPLVSAGDMDSGDMDERIKAADRECYAAHLASAQEHGDLGGDNYELSFGEDCDGAIYSFASDNSGVTVRRTEPGYVFDGAGNLQIVCDMKVQRIWIPNSLFGAMRRAMEAAQEWSA